MALSFLYVVLRWFLGAAVGRFRSEIAKDIEIAVLRHELAILGRQVKRPAFRPLRPGGAGATQPPPSPPTVGVVPGQA